MSSPLKCPEPQPFSLFCLHLFSFSSILFFPPKNTVFGIPLACAPKSNLKLIQLSSSRADSPFTFGCSVMRCSYEEFFWAASDTVVVFVAARALLGYVKLCKSLPLLHFFPGIGKILAQIYGTMCHPMYYFLSGLWHSVLYILLAPGVLSWNISRLFPLPMESKHRPLSTNFTVAWILLGRFWLLCLVWIPGLLQILCQCFVPTCESVSSLRGFSPSHTPWNCKTLSCIRMWTSSSILFVLCI